MYIHSVSRQFLHRLFILIKSERIDLVNVYISVHFCQAARVLFYSWSNGKGGGCMTVITEKQRFYYLRRVLYRGKFDSCPVVRVIEGNQPRTTIFIYVNFSTTMGLSVKSFGCIFCVVFIVIVWLFSSLFENFFAHSY